MLLDGPALRPVYHDVHRVQSCVICQRSSRYKGIPRTSVSCSVRFVRSGICGNPRPHAVFGYGTGVNRQNETYLPMCHSRRSSHIAQVLIDHLATSSAQPSTQGVDIFLRRRQTHRHSSQSKARLAAVKAVLLALRRCIRRSRSLRDISSLLAICRTKACWCVERLLRRSQLSNVKVWVVVGRRDVGRGRCLRRVGLWRRRVCAVWNRVRIGVRDRDEGGGRHHVEMCRRKGTGTPGFTMEDFLVLSSNVIFVTHASRTGSSRAFLCHDTCATWGKSTRSTTGYRSGLENPCAHQRQGCSSGAGSRITEAFQLGM